MAAGESTRLPTFPPSLPQDQADMSVRPPGWNAFRRLPWGLKPLVKKSLRAALKRCFHPKTLFRKFSGPNSPAQAKRGLAWATPHSIMEVRKLGIVGAMALLQQQPLAYHAKNQEVSMAYRRRPPFAFSISILVLVAACSLASRAAAPKGWFLAGSKPTQYESGIDALGYNDRPSAFLKAKESRVEGFGTLMQDFRADRFEGKRVRFSAFVRTERAQDWAGLWMRVDNDSKPVAFDNMQDRPIKGTTDWKKYEVVLDVPQNATGISLGVLLNGTGSVWLSNAQFEIVGPSVLTTSGPSEQTKPNEPINLGFED